MLCVEPGVSMHGVGHNPPLVGALVPVPCVLQARVRVVLLDLSRFDSFPGVLGDFLAARDPHGLQDFDDQRVIESFRFYKVDYVFHVHQKLSSLEVLV